MSAQIVIAVQACQKTILLALAERPRTFFELFELCGFSSEGRAGKASHERILDRSLQGLRRHGDIVYSRKTVMWNLVASAAREQAST